MPVCVFCRQPIEKANCGAWVLNKFVFWKPPAEEEGSVEQPVNVSEEDLLQRAQNLFRGVKFNSFKEPLHVNCLEPLTQQRLHWRLGELPESHKNAIRARAKASGWTTHF